MVIFQNPIFFLQLFYWWAFYDKGELCLPATCLDPYRFMYVFFFIEWIIIFIAFICFDAHVVSKATASQVHFSSSFKNLILQKPGAVHSG